MTLGNISKETRRDIGSGASILVAYLPVGKLSTFKKSSQSDVLANIFHEWMAHVLEPVKAVGLNGIRLACADGWACHCHPILAAYVADNPEQCLITCVKTSRCFECKILSDQRGECFFAEPRDHRRTTDDLHSHVHMNQSTTSYKEDGLNPVGRPFWAHLPYTDIFQCITPDLLHQIHRGVFKDHLLKWCQGILGKSELDA
jgi:hypothetical protein